MKIDLFTFEYEKKETAMVDVLNIQTTWQTSSFLNIGIYQGYFSFGLLFSDYWYYAFIKPILTKYNVRTHK